MDGLTFRSSRGGRDLLSSDRDVLQFPAGGVFGKAPAASEEADLERDVEHTLRLADAEVRSLIDDVHAVLRGPHGDGDDFFPSAA